MQKKPITSKKYEFVSDVTENDKIYKKFKAMRVPPRVVHLRDWTVLLESKKNVSQIGTAIGLRRVDRCCIIGDVLHSDVYGSHLCDIDGKTFISHCGRLAPGFFRYFRS